MRTTISISVITLLTFGIAGGQEFDSTNSMTLKGKVAGFFLDRPSYLILETNDGKGKAQTWAVQGADAGKLIQAGWNPQGTVSAGDEVSVVAYKTKFANAAGALPKPMSADTTKAIAELARTGHLVRGTELTLPGGKKFPFGQKP